MLTDIKNYLDTVCEQIRFQKAHDSIKQELQNHISDQSDAFIEEGLDEQQAIQKAIHEMGDPITVGTALDRVHRPNMHWGFFAFVLLLSFTNFTLRFIIMNTDSMYDYPSLFTTNNIISLFISIAIIILFYHIDFTALANYSKIIYCVYVLMIAGVSFWSNVYSGGNTGGACYFIISYYFSIVVPPLIYLFPIILIGLLYECRGQSYGGIFLCGASFLPPAFFSMNLRMDIAVLIVAFISFLLILLAAFKGWFAVTKSRAVFFVFAMAVFACIILLCTPMRYQLLYFFERITPGMRLFQMNAKTAAIFGMGEPIISPYDNLPYNFSYIAFWSGAEYYTALILRYLGWLPFCLLLIIYFFFIIKGFLLAKKQKSQLGSMTAFAILLTFTILAIWNVATNSGFFVYINPLQMPFFAAGGTANMIFSIMMGILLSVFRTGKYVKDNTVSAQQQKSFLSWQDGTLTLTIAIKKQKKGRDSIE